MKFFKYICLIIFIGQSYAQKSDFKTISFQKADSIALAYKYEKLYNIPELSLKLTSQLPTDVEKFRAIYKWVCENIANDYSQYFKNTRKRYHYKEDSIKLKDWNDQYRKIAFKKLLNENKATCTGYAYLVKELSKHADLQCEIVNGYARTSNTDVDKIIAPNHSWNAIKLNGKWYLCDPTWASGIQDPERLRFVFKYNDGLFLTSPEIFAINHHPVDEKWLLLKDNPSFETFIEAPILYGEAYTYLNGHNTPKQMHNQVQKKERVIFKFKLQRTIDRNEISLHIDNGHQVKQVRPKISKIDGEYLFVEHAFKSSGFYDVHFYIGKDIISTYTFKVKKG